MTPDNSPKIVFNRPKTTVAPKKNDQIIVDDVLENVNFRISSKAHIVLNSTICEGCSDRRCLIACPASLFVETSNGSMIFNYENCFECGTCYLVCNQEGAITWNYPTGGYGVDFLHS